MSYQTLNVPEFGVVERYEAELAKRGYSADRAQRKAIDRLQVLYTALLDFKVARNSLWRKWFNRPDVPRSVYLWGGVGRGKSFIMDCFYDAVPYKRKRRVHFHHFMHEVHENLRQFKDAPDPLLQVAEQISIETRLLCFDEFHVSDIADAMILGRLLDFLFGRGLILVATSNYPPDGLYPNGLQRQNFLPTIALLKSQCDVIEVDDGTDYRLRTLERLDTYLVGPEADTDNQLRDQFFALSGEYPQDGSIELAGRVLSTLGNASGIIWFDFAALCEGPRSQNDYLEIARGYSTLLLSNVPLMRREHGNEARRFTWLIDVLYDCRVKLIMSAQGQAPDLYREGPHAQEFTRTVSRLIEMRSREYLAEKHRPPAY